MSSIRFAPWAGTVALASAVAGAALLSAERQTTSPILPLAHPGARWGHAMAWDSARDRVVLFGGAASTTAMLADTWVWDGQAWTRIEVEGPSPRAYAAATYDSARGRVVLHGGRDEQRRPLDDTWEWDGGTWHRQTAEGPAARDHHALAYDAARRVSVLFGGYDGGAVRADTWEWDGRAWHPAATEGPPPRAAFAMSYDPERRSTMLYGGLWLGGLYADVWSWNGTRWQVLTEPYAHPTLDHHAATYDPARRAVLFFGGKDYRSTARNELIELRGDDFVTLPADGPPPRYNTAIVYDSRRGQHVVFGGRIRQGDTFLAYDDLWTWNGRDWQQRTP